MGKIGMEKQKLKVMVIRPHEKPEMVEIEDSLEAMQRLVGGWIEEYMPFDDDVAIICNEEGKYNSSKANRAIYDRNGGIKEIIFGDFFLCNAPIESEKLLSLTPEQERKYMERFKNPEAFFYTSSGVVAKDLKSRSSEWER